MAKMWPKALPSEIRNDSLRRAEMKVYEKMREQLDDSFTVFYSRPWLGLNEYGEEIDGECDFVVAHPDYGLLFLEVKGGGISYKPEDESWYSTDRNKIVRKIKNPVQQAMKSKHYMIDNLKKTGPFKNYFIKTGHGVIFPDCKKTSSFFGMDKPKELFCFMEDVEENIKEWIETRYDAKNTSSPGAEPLGKERMKILENILAHPFQLSVPLNAFLKDEDLRINVLSQDQFHILKAMEQNNRLAISGGAGTGKTVLAMEKAFRSAESGLKTLFTCYNRALATDVSNKIGENANLDVMTFHALCLKIGKNSGLEAPHDVTKAQLFGNDLPDLLLNGLDLFPDQKYDAIVVDEGQDFFPLWWVAIEALAKSKDSCIWVFYDNNQKVYPEASSGLSDFKAVPILLHRNLRNTKHIHRAAMKHYKGTSYESYGPEGEEVYWNEIEDERLLGKKISNMVNQLISSEHVPLENIAVLVPNEAVGKPVKKELYGKNIKCRDCVSTDSDGIVFETVRKFKGLESPIVFLAVTEDICNSPELVYVALTRGRLRLYCIGNGKALKKLQDPV